MLATQATRRLDEFLSAADRDALRAYCELRHPVDLADELRERDLAGVQQVLAVLPPRLQAEVFAALDTDQQVRLAGELGRRQLANIVSLMSHDERADLVGRLSEEEREALLPALAQAERDDILRLTSYRDGTAGAVMTSDYASVPPDLTVAQALARLRQIAPDRETIYYVYVVDSARRLMGFLTLKDLILARPDARVGDLMNTDIITVRLDDDQEQVAQIIARYDLLAVPVVNGDDVLLGIVTHDDALDILEQEHTEDLEKFMAIAGRHEGTPYLRQSAWHHFRSRVGWVVGLAALGLASGVIIHRFEDTLTRLLILALYMPMVADTGGNTGSQAATVVVRALALGDVRPRDLLAVLWKELLVSALLAVILGLLAFGKVLYLSQHSELPPGYTLVRVGAAIALALGMQVITATLIGAALPLIAAKFRLDPAVVASPALTTVVDITGLLLYFGVAHWLLF